MERCYWAISPLGEHPVAVRWCKHFRSCVPLHIFDWLFIYFGFSDPEHPKRLCLFSLAFWVFSPPTTPVCDQHKAVVLRLYRGGVVPLSLSVVASSPALSLRFLVLAVFTHRLSASPHLPLALLCYVTPFTSVISQSLPSSSITASQFPHLHSQPLLASKIIINQRWSWIIPYPTFHTSAKHPNSAPDNPNNRPQKVTEEQRIRQKWLPSQRTSPSSPPAPPPKCAPSPTAAAELETSAVHPRTASPPVSIRLRWRAKFTPPVVVDQETWPRTTIRKLRGAHRMLLRTFPPLFHLFGPKVVSELSHFFSLVILGTLVYISYTEKYYTEEYIALYWKRKKKKRRAWKGKKKPLTSQISQSPSPSIQQRSARRPWRRRQHLPPLRRGGRGREVRPEVGERGQRRCGREPDG